MTEIAIVYWQHRRNYIPLWTYLLDKIKPENKKLCKIYFLTSGYLDIHSETNIEHETIQYGSLQAFPGCPGEHIGNLIEKANFLASVDAKYVIRTGEDVFINPHVLDFAIENRQILDNFSNMALIPCENLGVPSCELFIDNFCTTEEKNKIYKMFLNTDMKLVADRWSIPELENLNKHTLNAKTWDFNQFVKSVSQLPLYKLGIHPIRFNPEAQVYLCELIINNIERFLKQQQYEITTPNIIHTCDNWCMMTSLMLKNIQKEFTFKEQDEIAINLYMRKHHLNCLWIKNGFTYTDVYAYITRYDPKTHNQWYQEDQNRHNQLSINCRKYYQK